MNPVLGIFVGGRAERMGGRDKAQLTAPDTGEALAVRLARVGRDAGCEPVLVGTWDAHASLLPDCARLDDAPPGVGPLGGLAALLAHADGRPAIAVACDMPHVTAALLGRLAAAPAAEAVAPRDPTTGKWQPLCARYAPSILPRVRDALDRGVRSFQTLYGELDVHELDLGDDEQPLVADWDRPEDVR